MIAHRLTAIPALSLALGSCMGPSELENYLQTARQRYSTETHMVGTKWDGPTYHTRVATGTWVHSTVASLDYALALLHRDEEGDRARAEQILDKVISLQETSASDKHYGLFPWFLEEPIEEMAPPDRNWADFCGARLAHILVDHGTKLRPEVLERTKRSLGHAARAIRERDVSPSYTNIAVMGSGVTLVAGEQLHEPGLLRYGREKLEQVIAHTQKTSNFSEYNSPVYTFVVIWECERTLHLVTDKASRVAADKLRHIAWRTIAESFHPATAQWAGPHSRAYSDRLTQGQVQEISDRLGFDLEVHPTQSGGKLYPFWTTPTVPCPETLMDRFSASSKTPREIRRTFRLARRGDDAIVGTTWMARDVCLGSVNRASLWVQRRPLVAYWRTDEDPAVVLRLRSLKDGRDFSAIGVSNDQKGPNVSSSFFVFSDRGTWHRHLDKPKDATYVARDLRIRYELRGEGVTARRLGEGRYELRAGEHRAVIHTTSGEFFGREVKFKVGEEKGVAYLDVVLHEGEERSFDFREAGIVGLTVELEIFEGEKAYEIGTVITPSSQPSK